MPPEDPSSNGERDVVRIDPAAFLEWIGMSAREFLLSVLAAIFIVGAAIGLLLAVIPVITGYLFGVTPATEFGYVYSFMLAATCGVLLRVVQAELHELRRQRHSGD